MGLQWASDESGKHTRLKISRLKNLVGSSPTPPTIFIWRDGRVWLIALVLKTNNGASRSGVQIPISSPMG